MRKLLIIVPVISLGMVCFLLVGSGARPGSELAASLPHDVLHANLMFDRRIKARFPLGSSAAAMERVLVADGFGRAQSFRDERYVRLDRSAGFFLEESLVVTWSSDRDKLTMVQGTYGLTGP